MLCGLSRIAQPVLMQKAQTARYVLYIIAIHTKDINYSRQHLSHVILLMLRVVSYWCGKTRFAHVAQERDYLSQSIVYCIYWDFCVYLVALISMLRFLRVKKSWKRIADVK